MALIDGKGRDASTDVMSALASGDEKAAFVKAGEALGLAWASAMLERQ